MDSSTFVKVCLFKIISPMIKMNVYKIVNNTGAHLLLSKNQDDSK